MFDRTVVILFSGKAGVGKTTCADFMLGLARDLSAIRMPMATELKNIAVEVFDWDGKKDDRGRKLLQNLGQVARDYNENFWVSKAFNKLSFYINYPFDLVVVDDWRFPNEYNYLNSKPMYYVYRARVFSPDREILKGSELYYDVSETSLTDVDDYDFRIVNTGSLDDLHEQLENIFEYIKNKHTYGGRK